MKRKIIYVLCAVIFCGLIPQFAHGESDGKTLLAMGDSISAGYGLDDPKTQGFIYGILDSSGKVFDKSISGNTAKGILDQLQNNEHENYISSTYIKNADFVTITCGGNDLMAVLYEKAAEKWNEAYPDKKIEGKEVALKLAQKDLGLLMTIVNLLNPESESYLINDEDFDEALEKYTENLKNITSHINSLNVEAVIVVSTQYNPYFEFKGTNFDIVYRGMEDGVKKLNEAIFANSYEGGYIVSDTKKAFDAYDGEGDLYNADLVTMNVDFHPSATGHKVLSESFKNTISQIKYSKIKLCHYFESLEGTYSDDLLKTEEYVVCEGKKIFAREINEVGFTLNESFEESIFQGDAKDGLVLKLYYSRNVYKIGWHTYEDIFFESYKYGAPIVSPDASRKGYKFVGWDTEVPETMPANDQTFVAMWEKKKISPVALIIGILVISAVVVSYIAYEKEHKKNEEN